MATYSKYKQIQTNKYYGAASINNLLMKRWWSVEKPLKRPNPNHYFLYNRMMITGAVNNGVNGGMAPLGVSGIYNSGTYNSSLASIGARNKALTKLQTDYGEAAMALVNAMERKQAYNMLLNRSLQLLGVLKAIRKRDEIALAAALFTPASELERARKGQTQKAGRKVRKGDFRKRAKDVSATWLEYHFGWDPLVKDIYNCVKILENPYDPKVVIKRATGSETVYDGNRSDYNRWRVDRVSKYGWRLSAKLSVSNPNLFRASQLGLVNPAAVAWELVPFSFVVDWFLPVGEFLNSYSNLFGVTVQDPLSTVLETTTRNHTTYWSGSRMWGSFDYQHIICERTLALPTYTLRRKQFKGFSVARGATAISLLIQQLKSHS